MNDKSIKNSKIIVSGSTHVSIQSEIYTSVSRISKKEKYSNSAMDIQKLNKLLKANIDNIDKKETEQLISNIHHRNPSALREIYEVLKDTTSGTAGGVLATWVMSFLNSIPK